MKGIQTGDKPGLMKLKNDVEKNKRMVRQAAPITVKNKEMNELEIMGETIYRKAQIKKKRARRALLSRIF